MDLRNPVALWKAASARQRLLLASGSVAVAALITWDVWTVLQRHVTFAEFAWVFVKCALLTIGVMAIGQRTAKVVGSEVRRRRTAKRTNP